MRTKDKLISNWKDIDEEIEIKTDNPDSVGEEIIFSDSLDRVPPEEIPIGGDGDDAREQAGNLEHSTKNLLLRGLLSPECEQSCGSVSSTPVVKRCCIEHCYFSRHLSKSSRYNLRRSPGNTLQFENENSNEQQTVEYLAAEDVNSLSDSVDKNNVRDRREGDRSSSSSTSSSSCGSDIENLVDDSNDRDYCPDGNSTDSDNGSVSSVKEVWESGNRNDVKEVSVPKTSSFNRIARSTYPKTNIPSDFVSVHDLLAKIRNMQKLMKTSKKFGGEAKAGKVPQSRLKKVSRGKREEFSKMSEYLFPVPNLTKMVNGDKNWGVEYDEVQSLGLDDLLLKASELNAENFTKALGRKLEPVKPNFNAKDSSEIVFTIPKPKDSADEDPKREGADGEFPKRPSTIKLDISKPFFEAEKAKESEASKPPEEASPKRPGIKVKTVENINEEFKDSLGLKNNIFQDCGMDKGMSLLDNFRAPSVPEKEGRQEDPEKTGEGRPFIMTIIQSKTEKQRPAILRNSSYFKKKTKPAEKSGEANEGRTQDDPSSEGLLEGKKQEENHTSDSQPSTNPDKGSFNGLGLSKSESFHRGYGKSRGSQAKETELDVFKCSEKNEGKIEVRKKNIPFILKRSRKPRITEVDSKLVKVNEPCERVAPAEKTFKVMSIEQKLGPKEANRRFIKVVPYEPANKPAKKVQGKAQPKLSDDESEKSTQKGSGHILSLNTFYSILKEILPDRWVMCLDNKYGLQIFKTHVDKLLNPSILISVVIARCGKVTVNVRGKQLQKSHEIFSDICDIRNSDNKLSLNYVLTILNRLRCLSVCFGCDDLTLKKYWREDGFVEHQTEFQQVFRSNMCQLLVSMGKKRCGPCYKLNETLKILHRRDKIEDKPPEKDSTPKETTPEEVEESDPSSKARGVKRNLEDFLEESFSTMKQQITDEIEKNKKLGEQENAMKTQEEVLSFMGLARKDSLDNPVRKSKRKKNSFYKLQQPVAKKKIDQQELEFLEKYWADINTLFSTSLLFGAYSRTGRGRLREKCRMFKKLLTTWRDIVKSNPEWIGGEISLPDDLTDGDGSAKDSTTDHFEKMDVPALRSYIINSVKEVNRIKHKLRTRNSYFKLLYNKFVKRRMKRSKTLPEPKGTGSSANSTTNTPTPTDLSSDESSRDKGKTTDDETRAVSDLIMTCVSDGD